MGKRVSASSPQGRFAAGAAEIDGHVMTDARAVGKQMFLQFDNGLSLHVHLGMYGAWDFAGEITADATVVSAGGRMGQTNQRGTVVGAFEDSLRSIGAPRRTRLRMAESEKLEAPIESFPPEPIGAVRVRLLTADAVADLRGPTRCEVIDEQAVLAAIAKLGPDPLVDTGRKAEDTFVATVRKKPTGIGVLLMDQSVVAGIGNVYRAELLFRARLNPHTPGNAISEQDIRALWKDWTKLLTIGVRTGQMMTMDGLDATAYNAALASRADRHWVYHRSGQPCRVCGAPIVMELAAGRTLYWCPVDQA